MNLGRFMEFVWLLDICLLHVINSLGNYVLASFDCYFCRNSHLDILLNNSTISNRGNSHTLYRGIF